MDPTDTEQCSTDLHDGYLVLCELSPAVEVLYLWCAPVPVHDEAERVDAEHRTRHVLPVIDVGRLSKKYLNK